MSTAAAGVPAHVEYDECVEPLERGITMLEDLGQRHPLTARDREEMALAHAHLAVANSWLYLDTGPDLAHRRKASALYEELHREFPAVPAYLRVVANAHANLGVGLWSASQPNEAIEQFQQALALCEKQRADFPDLSQDRVLIAHIRHWLGAALRDTGRWEEAEREYRIPHDLREQLVAEQPNDAGFKAPSAHIKIYLAELLRQTGRPAEGEELLHRPLGGTQVQFVVLNEQDPVLHCTAAFSCYAWS